MNDIPIFAKTYDLLLWLVPTTLKYPREHRFALALRTQQAAFEFNELIVLARKSREKRDLLTRADAHLEQVRLYLRLAHDLKLITLRQYEHVSREVSAVGALLGAWIQRSGAGGEPAVARGASYTPPEPAPPRGTR
ncbi:MAG: diversity-generating retroelement protein Avd [Chloroflexales bacterium]